MTLYLFYFVVIGPVALTVVEQAFYVKIKSDWQLIARLLNQDSNETVAVMNAWANFVVRENLVIYCVLYTQPLVVLNEFRILSRFSVWLLNLISNLKHKDIKISKSLWFLLPGTSKHEDVVLFEIEAVKTTQVRRKLHIQQHPEVKIYIVFFNSVKHVSPVVAKPSEHIDKPVLELACPDMASCNLHLLNLIPLVFERTICLTRVKCVVLTIRPHDTSNCENCNPWVNFVFHDTCWMVGNVH